MATIQPDFGSSNQAPSAQWSAPLATNATAQFVANVGDQFGIPRIGVAQFLNGGQPVAPQKGQAYAADGGGAAPANKTPIGPSGPPAGYRGNGSFGDPNNPDLSNPSKQTDYNNYLASLGQQQNSLIDEAYGQSNQYLDQAEQALRADLPNALQAAQSNYDVNAQQLGDTRTSANENFNTQKGKATTSYENALADARRLYQEQQTGANQRFGGASSAGQAFSEIQSREQARQFGQTNRSYTDVLNQVETQRGQVEREYNTGLLQLQQQKQTAVDQANRDFQNKLLQISQNRAQLGQAKAEARLQALQQLRSEVFAISQQNTQFEQALAMQKQQAQQQLGAYSQSVLGATNQTGALTSAYNPQISAPYSASAGLGNTSTGQPQFQGQVGGNKNQDIFGQIGGAVQGAATGAYDFLNKQTPLGEFLPG